MLGAAWLIATASVAAAQARIVTRPEDAVAHAAEWVDAVLAHQPGATDAAVALVGGWTAVVVKNLPVDIASIRKVMRDPRARVFQVPIELSPRVDQEIRYSRREREALAAAAERVVGRGLSDTDLLARGVVLHTDIALFNNGTGTILRFADGQSLDVERNRGDHWEAARTLANALDKKTGREPDVAAWYRATLAALSSIHMWNATHAERALARFSDDPELQFLVGCQHETLASPLTQSSIASTRLPPATFLRVRSASGELKDAASLLQRALELNPRHAEARVHYGRVLTQIDRAAQAVIELRRAAAEATEPVLRYYAQLFLGAALEETNDVQAAREAYRAAARVVPRAQAPRLALSQLALASGKRGEAVDAIEPLLLPDNNEDDARDPWWSYFVSCGRNATALIGQASERLVTPRAAER